MRALPDGLTLAYDGDEWRLSFGRYLLVVPGCSCTLPTCTCRRRPALDQWRGTHHWRHCHSGHAEHIAVIFRRAVFGVRS